MPGGVQSTVIGNNELAMGVFSLQSLPQSLSSVMGHFRHYWKASIILNGHLHAQQKALIQAF